MPIANLSSNICQTPSTQSVLIVTLLPIQIMSLMIPEMGHDEQQQSDREELNKILWQVLQPLTLKQNTNTETGYYNLLCAGGYCRHCTLVSAGWLTNYNQYGDQYYFEWHFCIWCQNSKNKLGNKVLPDKTHPWQGHNLYWIPSDSNTMAADDELLSCEVPQKYNMFWHIPTIVSQLL